MAIVAAGKYRGRNLVVPKGDTRPTRRHMRLSIFDFLADFVEGASVLDLFAGTGAFGIEALSRGARKAIFVEIAKKAVLSIKENLRSLQLKENGVVYLADSQQFLMRSIKKHRKFDIIFIDPPYTKLRKMEPEEYTSYMLELISRSQQLLVPKAIIIIKYPKKLPIEVPTGLVTLEDKRYGLNLVSFLGQERYLKKLLPNDSESKVS